MKSIVINVILVFALNSMSSAQEEVQIVGDQDYLPIIGLDQGKPSGFLIERLNKISKKIKTPIKVQLFPWARAFKTAETDDVGIIGISWNKERAEKFDFTEPVFVDSILLVVRKDSQLKFDKLEDLKNVRIGAQIGASYGNDVDEFFKSIKDQIQRDGDRSHRLLKLLNNRIDVALIGNGIEGFNRIVANNRELSKQVKQFKILPKRLNEDKLYLAFRKDLNQGKLIQKINGALTKIR